MRSRRASLSRSARAFCKSGPFRPRALQVGFHLAARSLDFRAGDDVAIHFGDDLFDHADVGGETEDAARARDAQTVRNFIYDYCSNYTGRSTAPPSALLS